MGWQGLRDEQVEFHYIDLLISHAKCPDLRQCVMVRYKVSQVVWWINGKMKGRLVKKCVYPAIYWGGIFKAKFGKIGPVIFLAKRSVNSFELVLDRMGRWKGQRYILGQVCSKPSWLVGRPNSLFRCLPSSLFEHQTNKPILGKLAQSFMLTKQPK